VVISRINPISAAKVFGLIYVVIGLCIGVLVFLGSLLGGAALGRSGLGFGSGLGIGAVIVLPIIYGVIGFIVTLIGAGVYNWAAGVVGGIKVDLD
jgi:hypothetical protein